MEHPCIMCSGGFDPIHEGHIEYLERASKYGNVIVALNSDDWLLRKKGFVVQTWTARKAILSALRCVHSVVAVDDSDDTVRSAIHQVGPTYFGKGGDRTATNTPESEVCQTLGVKMVYGLGDKIQSSSRIVSKPEQVHRPWGYYTVLETGVGYKVKRVRISNGSSLSLQYHNHRSETWSVVVGECHVRVGDDRFILRPGDAAITIEAKTLHRASAPLGHCTFIEVQRGTEVSEDDIVRVEDVYGRA